MKKRQVVLILGKSGTGKTFLAKKLRTKARRSITIDPNGEYGGLVVRDVTELVEVLLEKKDDEFEIVCRFEDESQYEYVFRVVWTLGDLLLVVDEADDYIDVRSPSHEFLRLIKRGRHRNISIICIAQRVPDMVISVRAQFTTMITFRQDIPSDIDLLERYGFEREELLGLTYEMNTQNPYLFIGEDIFAAEISNT